MSLKPTIDVASDPELNAMLEVFSALKELDTDAQNRVLEYVERRLNLHRNQFRESLENPERAIAAESEQGPQSFLPSDDRRIGSGAERQEDEAGGLEGISPVAKKWMQRNDLTVSRMSNLFTLGVDEIDLIARKVPGKSGRERLHNVILLQGIASYLSSGAPRIDNAKLTEAMRHYDADVGRNFSAYLKDWASEVSGSRAGGDLTLTTRGLNSAKELIKQMTEDMEK